ncbi:MAG: hypothetical protein AB7U44_07450 [Sulfuricurvum sp.]
MVWISEKKQISFDRKINEFDKIIKKKNHFEISSRALMFLSFSFLFLIVFFFFKSGNPLMIAIAIMISIVIFVAFIASAYKDVLTIDFQKDYFIIKYQFFTKKYSYTELSDIDIYFLSMKSQTKVSLTIGKYGEEVVMINNEPLELFFYAQFALKRFLNSQEFTYSEIYQMLNETLQNEVKTIAILKRRYQLA